MAKLRIGIIGTGGIAHSHMRAFVEAVQEGKPAPIPTSEIIYNQAIIDGIIRSNASGHEIEVEIPEI